MTLQELQAMIKEEFSHFIKEQPGGPAGAPPMPPAPGGNGAIPPPPPGAPPPGSQRTVAVASPSPTQVLIHINRGGNGDVDWY